MDATPKKQTSGTIAIDRLKLLLVSERVDCSPEVMEMLRNDMIQVISKYMLIDTNGFDIRITKNATDEDTGEGTQSLYANVPIRGRKPSSSLH